MTRGRKKNLNLPLSRSLEQQRAFRARRAQHIASLEERCHKAEAENELLRREIADLRAIGAPNNTNPELLRASMELMQNISSTTASLSRFQEVVQLGTFAGVSPPLLNRSNAALTTAVPQNCAVPHLAAPINRIFHSAGPHPVDNIDNILASNAKDDLRSPSCCAGMLDCRSLVESDEDEQQEHTTMSRTRTSGLRSTSQSEPNFEIERH